MLSRSLERKNSTHKRFEKKKMSLPLLRVLHTIDGEGIYGVERLLRVA